MSFADHRKTRVDELLHPVNPVHSIHCDSAVLPDTHELIKRKFTFTIGQPVYH